MSNRYYLNFTFVRWMIGLFALIACLSMWGGTAMAQTVSKATGGGSISADKNINGNGYDTLSGPSIRETAVAQLVENETIVLTAPSGFEWNPNANVTDTVRPAGANKSQLELTRTGLTTDKITFEVTKQSKSGGQGQGPGEVTFYGIEVRPTTGTIPNTGYITNTGTTGPGGSTNYGDLEMIPGARAAINVETKSDGSGSTVSAQNITAGNSLTVYSISRDQFGNFKQNINVSESGWQLINITGSVVQDDLTPAATAREATFSPTSTGSAQIEATLNEGNANPSGTLTVVPAVTDHLTITKQPSAQATAGTNFSQQPELELRDQYGNTVTDDDSRQVTASATDGDVTLFGTTSLTPTNGVISFTDLYAETADTTTLTFESSGLSSVESNSITIVPADPADLGYKVQPSNTVKGNSITPAVKLQLKDPYGNNVPRMDSTVSITQVGSGALLNPPFTATTNSNGVASFSNIDVKQSASSGAIKLEADIANVSMSPVESSEFLVLDADALSEFEITDTNDNPLGSTTAGQSFDIKIKALDGAGNLYNSYQDPVNISSTNGTITQGSGSTANFTDGVLDPHTVTITSAGDINLTATNPNNSNITGKDTITVNPAAVFDNNTSVSTDPASITADGSSTSNVTVQLKDEYGNNLQSGGADISIATTAGQLDDGTTVGDSLVANDNGDGTYTLTLQSSTVTETATLRVYRGGNLINDSQTVEFTAGELADFIIRAPDSTTVSKQTAGVQFNIDIWAVDANNNQIPSYSGSLTITSSVGGITSGGSPSISGGQLSNHGLTINEADSSVTLSVTDGSSVTGQSSSFVIEAAGADVSTSIVRAKPNLIQNDGISTSEISIILRDQFDNRVYRDRLADLSLDTVRNIRDFKNETPTLDGLVFNQAEGVYLDTLTSSSTLELVTFEAKLSGNSISDKDSVDIVLPNMWECCQQPGDDFEWNNGDNWSQGEIPTSDDFVIIPTNPANGSTFPDIDEDITIGSLEIQSGANITFTSSQTFTVENDATVDGDMAIDLPSNIFINGSLKGSGSFSANGSNVTEVKEDLTIESFTSGATDAIVRMNGSSEQILGASSFNVYELQIRSDVENQTEYPIVGQLAIDNNNTFNFPTGAQDTLDVRDISGNGRLDLNDNRMYVRGNIDVQDLGTKDAKINFVDTSASPTKQTIKNFQEVGELVVNNSADLRVFSTNNMTVHNQLILESGSLELPSGVNLLLNNDAVVNGGSIRAIRKVNTPKGWRQISSPVTSTFNDFLDSTTTQGYTGASLTSDTLQPNVLWYKEDATGTDNQRWRAPGDAANNLTAGRGYFVYFFGDITNDSRYTDPLPHKLTVEGSQGAEFDNSSSFNFSVTYNPDATPDTGSVAGSGWNLVGNPFTATLDWDDANWTKSNVDNVIYIWSATDGEYKDWNGSSGSLGDGLISPFQGFWVKASGSSPSLSVDNNQVKTLGGVFLNKSGKEKEDAPGFKLQLAGRDTTEMNFSFSEEGSREKDRYDGYELEPMENTGKPSIYSVLPDGNKLSINNLPLKFGKPIEVPVGISSHNGESLQGEFTVAAQQLDRLPEGWKISIKDKNTGDTQTLSSSRNYSFNISRGKAKAPDSTESVDSLAKAGPKKGFKYKMDKPVVANTSKAKDTRFVLVVEPGEDNGDLPDEFALYENYPNPFNPATKIEFDVPIESDVRLDVYNILGRRVATLVDRRMEAGQHQVEWRADNLASGVYIYRLTTEERQFTRKMTLIK